jgi:hypothetical protein
LTEEEKQYQLARIAKLAAIAELNGLMHTAKSWRELYTIVLMRPAGEIVFASRLMHKPPNPI